MDTASLPALAALSGSTIGGFITFFATWRGVRAQVRAQQLLHDKSRREELYREFAEEASALYIDALTRDTPDPGRVVRLYALVSRMRILSTPSVIAEADRIARLIAHSYTEPNKSVDELRVMLSQDVLDPLCAFAEVCRNELEGRPRRSFRSRGRPSGTVRECSCRARHPLSPARDHVGTGIGTGHLTTGRKQRA